VVMAAAVADFRPAARAEGKLSRRTGDGAMTLVLEPTPDLLAGLGSAPRPRPYLIGFAAEIGSGGDIGARAAAKLQEKRCDVIVANDVSRPGIGFGADDNAVTVLFADGTRQEIPRAPKAEIADRLWALLAPRLAAAREESLRRTYSMNNLSNA